MKQPYYALDESTRLIIIELLNKAKELDSVNVNFHYYAAPGSDDTDFYITEYKNYWELVVKQRWKKTTDIYKILDGSITYDYSKKD